MGRGALEGWGLSFDFLHKTRGAERGGRKKRGVVDVAPMYYCKSMRRLRPRRRQRGVSMKPTQLHSEWLPELVIHSSDCNWRVMAVQALTPSQSQIYKESNEYISHTHRHTPVYSPYLALRERHTFALQPPCLLYLPFQFNIHYSLNTKVSKQWCPINSNFSFTTF